MFVYISSLLTFRYTAVHRLHHTRHSAQMRRVPPCDSFYISKRSSNPSFAQRRVTPRLRGPEAMRVATGCSDRRNETRKVPRSGSASQCSSSSSTIDFTSCINALLQLNGLLPRAISRGEPGDAIFDAHRQVCLVARVPVPPHSRGSVSLHLGPCCTSLPQSTEQICALRK